MRVLILLLALTTLGAAETEAPKLDPKLPAAVVPELRDYQADLDKIEAKAHADKVKRALELQKVLLKAQSDATK